MVIFEKLLEYFFPKQTSISARSNNDRLLEDAIGNAILIVMTASENAIKLDTATVSTIISAKNALKNGDISAKLETDFWQAYEKAAQGLHPITVDSIKATYDPDPVHRSIMNQIMNRNKIPLSRRCATNYKFLSLLTLSLLIAIQIYWYIGWTLTTDINTQTQEIIALNDQLIILNSENLDGTDHVNRLAKQHQQTKIRKIVERIEEHTAWKFAATNHLLNWNQVWSDMDLLTLQPWQIPNYESFSEEVKRRIQFVAAENTLQAITGYILPILYGLIGACFYILRQLPKEIESLTFSMNSYIDYSLRMAQGPLAGIMVSYFFASNQDGNELKHTTDNLSAVEPDLSTLSPLALAFLAGYSVEFIFRFLDKMLSSPINDQPSQNAQPKLGKQKRQKKAPHATSNEG